MDLRFNPEALGAANLRERGLTSDLPSDWYNQAISAAQQLLAAIGIVPMISMDVALALKGDSDWADHDETHRPYQPRR
jgi:hypothetical protein